ncbi:MAG: hypothetical protein QOD80_457 [Verrucomicrobiota bacterium]|jgi:hypothetical protein
MLTLREDKTHADDIRTTLLHARLCHQAWWVFTGAHPQRDAILAVYNRYLHFFEAVRPALFSTFIVKLASLFGTRSDEITLKMLPGSEDDPAFAALWERGRRLHRYRSKVIAHRDVEVLSKDFAKDTGFTYDSLKAILEDTYALFDRLADAHRFEHTFSFSSQDDLLALVNDLGDPQRI